MRRYEFNTLHFHLADDRGWPKFMLGDSIKEIDLLFYMILPGALALSKVGWINMEKQSWDNFKKKLQPHLKFLIEQAVKLKLQIDV